MYMLLSRFSRVRLCTKKINLKWHVLCKLSKKKVYMESYDLFTYEITDLQISYDSGDKKGFTSIVNYLSDHLHI